MSWDPAKESWVHFSSRLKAKFNLSEYEIKMVTDKTNKLSELTQELRLQNAQEGLHRDGLATA